MTTQGSSQSIRAIGAPDDDLTVQWSLEKMDLRVEPDGAAPWDVTIHTRLHTFKYRGDVIPVLYDPEDHDRVAFDYEADVQAAMAQAAADRAQARDRGQR